MGTPRNHAPAGFDALIEGAIQIDIVRLDASRIDVTLTNLGDGHDLPDGASFLRELSLVVDGDRRWLSSRLTRAGVEVVLPTEADTIVHGSIAAGASKTYRFDAVGPARACVEYRRFRPELLQALGVDAAEAGPLRTVACATE